MHTHTLVVTIKAISRHCQMSPGEGQNHPLSRITALGLSAAVYPLIQSARERLWTRSSLESCWPKSHAWAPAHGPRLPICKGIIWSTASSQFSTLQESLQFFTFKGHLAVSSASTAEVKGFLSISLFTSVIYFFLTFHCTVSLCLFFLSICIAFCVSLCVSFIPFWCGAFLCLYQYLSFYPDFCLILGLSLLVFISPVCIILLMTVFLGFSLNFLSEHLSFSLLLSVCISPGIFHDPLSLLEDVGIFTRHFCFWLSFFLFIHLSSISAFLWKWSICTRLLARSLSLGRKFFRHVLKTLYFYWMISLRGRTGNGLFS